MCLRSDEFKEGVKGLDLIFVRIYIQLNIIKIFIILIDVCVYNVY